MAPRKPKNPIKDISDAVGGWLGGNRGTINPQVARVSRDLGTVAQTIDTFTGGLGAAAGRDVRNFAQGESLPTNVAKTAAVNLAAGAVGAKAAQVFGRAVQSGRAAVKGTYFGVHGSETRGLSSINPLIGKPKPATNVTNDAARSAGYNAPNVPVAYSYPAQPNRVAGDLQTAAAYAREGSVYVVKTPQTNVNVASWNKLENYSTQPLKVIKEIKVPKLPNPAPMSATKKVKQSVETSITAARAANNAKMIRQVENVVRNQKAKTFLQGAIRSVKTPPKKKK
jgi:hypothetical protein